MAVERILVPIDFSPESLRAAAVAGDLAAQTGARIRFVTVLDVGDLRAALRVGLDQFRSEDDAHQRLRQWVNDRYATVQLPKGVASTRTIRRGIVEQEIVDAIRTYRPQLVVMGSRGLARRIPIGSRTEYVIRHAGVPVVVVPAPSRPSSGLRPPSPR